MFRTEFFSYKRKNPSNPHPTKRDVKGNRPFCYAPQNLKTHNNISPCKGVKRSPVAWPLSYKGRSIGKKAFWKEKGESFLSEAMLRFPSYGPHNYKVHNKPHMIFHDQDGKGFP